MQNRYVGDVGDFGKFGLLRHIFKNSSQWQLGVIWYLFPEETHNKDGRHIEYLEKNNFRICDIDLHEKLSKIVFQNSRNINCLENNDVLPRNTVFYNNLLDFHLRFPSQTKRDKQNRLMYRSIWIERAITKINKCNAVFVDPDNGLEINSCPELYQIKSGKFTYYNEIIDLFRGKDVCVIYHHLNRHKDHGTHDEQIRDRSLSLKNIVKPSGKLFSIRFKPYSPRTYFILCSKDKEQQIEDSLKSFLNSPWQNHWDLYYELQ